MISRRPAPEARSTPGCRPEPRNVFKGRGFVASLNLVLATNEWRKASSTTSLNEQLRASEASLALCRSASWIEIVVLMHQNVKTSHHDVNGLPKHESLSPTWQTPRKPGLAMLPSGEHTRLGCGFRRPRRKIVSAGRQHGHAGRVCSPAKEACGVDFMSFRRSNLSCVCSGRGHLRLDGGQGIRHKT